MEKAKRVKLAENETSESELTEIDTKGHGWGTLPYTAIHIIAKLDL